MVNHDHHMKLITVHFPHQILAIMDKLIAMKMFPNRSEFIRFAVTSQIIDLKILLREEL